VIFENPNEFSVGQRCNQRGHDGRDVNVQAHALEIRGGFGVFLFVSQRRLASAATVLADGRQGGNCEKKPVFQVISGYFRIKTGGGGRPMQKAK
jgi:hypothetical protein